MSNYLPICLQYKYVLLYISIELEAGINEKIKKSRSFQTKTNIISTTHSKSNTSIK